MIVLKLKSVTISLLLNVFTILLAFNVQAQDHPKLNLTKAGVAKIRAELGKVPLFDASLAAIKEEVDAENDNDKNEINDDEDD